MTDHTPPKKTAGDHVHAVTRAVIGSIPIVGTAGAELFQSVITPPLERRRQKWMENVGEALKKMEEKNLRQISDLAQDEAFIDTVMHASQVALRNNQKEKLEALHNAIMNAALPNSPDESLQQMFINLVDEMTVWHIRILYFFANPVRWFEEQGREPPQYTISSNLNGILTNAYPELANRREFCDQVGKDLYRRGLLSIENFYTMMSATGAYEPRATGLGAQFLKYISKPTQEA